MKVHLSSGPAPRVGPAIRTANKAWHVTRFDDVLRVLEHPQTQVGTQLTLHLMHRFEQSTSARFPYLRSIFDFANFSNLPKHPALRQAAGKWVQSFSAHAPNDLIRHHIDSALGAEKEVMSGVINPIIDDWRASVTGLPKSLFRKSEEELDELLFWLFQFPMQKGLTRLEQQAAGIFGYFDDIPGINFTIEQRINFLSVPILTLNTLTGFWGNLCNILAFHPDMQERLRTDAAVRSDFLRESDRMLGSLRVLVRKTGEDGIPLSDGVFIPGSELVYVDLFAANRDPDVWGDPNVLDTERSSLPNLTFAAGPHRCLGKHLAQTTTRVFLDELLAKCRLRPSDVPVQYNPNPALFSPQTLVLTLEHLS